MIYFLAKSLTGREGGSRAGTDILHGMLGQGRDITVVCRDRCPLPDTVDGVDYSPPSWVVPPETTNFSRRSILSPRAVTRRVTQGVRNRGLRRAIDDALRQHPPSLVVQNGFPSPDTINMELLDRFSNRLLIVHSAPEQVPLFQRNNPALSIEWVSNCLRGMENLAFVTPQIRDSWRQVAGLDRQRTFVLPNTTREEEAVKVRDLTREELRQSLGLPRDAFIVSCVGKVDSAKGQDILVDALPSMVASVPNLYVVFVGVITSFAKHLPNMVEAMGLSQHVSFVGLRDDPYAFIRASDLLIHPSRAEGQGLILLEAMILRTPVLACDVGGIPFAVQHDKTGLLIPPEDAGALAEAFAVLASDKSLRERFVREGEAHYWNVFSRKMHRERVQSMIETCVAETTPAIDTP